MKLKCQHLQLMKENNKIMSKEKAIEITKNLKQTLKSLGDTETVQSISSAYQSSRATKKMLNKKIEELQEKYKNQ